jgi:hypothetical protein
VDNFILRDRLNLLRSSFMNEEKTTEDEEEVSLDDAMAQANEELDEKCNELIAEVLYGA